METSSGGWGAGWEMGANEAQRELCLGNLGMERAGEFGTQLVQAMRRFGRGR